MKKAFTLSEVLITLVIIGVVAALTIPVLQENYLEKERIAKVKKKLFNACKCHDISKS